MLANGGMSALGCGSAVHVGEPEDGRGHGMTELQDMYLPGYMSMADLSSEEK